MNLKKIFFFILIFFGLYSCKEDKPQVIIDILLPSENTSFLLPDSIRVRAIITSLSRHLIRDVTVCLVDENFIPITSNLHFKPNTNSFELDVYLYIQDNNLPSSNYYVKIFVKVNDFQEFGYRKIYLISSPRMIETIYCVSKSLDNKLCVYAIDTLLQSSIQVLSLPFDYSGFDVCSNPQLLFLCGRYTNPFTAYSIKDNYNLLWQINAVIDPPAPYFECMDYNEKHVLIGFNDKSIKGYTEEGLLKFAFSLPQMKPQLFYTHKNFNSNDLLIVFAKGIPDYKKFLCVFYYQTQYLLHYLEIDFEPVSLFQKNNNQIYVFGNNLGKGLLKLYDIDKNILEHKFSFSNGSIYDVEKINNLFLISHQDGLFLYDGEVLSSYGNFEGKGKICFDNSTNSVFYGVKNKIYQFNFNNHNVQKKILLPDSIIDLEVLYNK